METKAEIKEWPQKDRRGTHIQDGVMWCPTCGSEPVTHGHKTCSVCQTGSSRMTAEELVEFAEREMANDPALRPEHQAARKKARAQSKAKAKSPTATRSKKKTKAAKGKRK